MTTFNNGQKRIEDAHEKKCKDAMLVAPPVNTLSLVVEERY